MTAPTHCELWEHPERVEAAEQFEQIATFEDDSHLIRRLLKCRECGQLYFFEFYEEIDWEHGNDPQYRTYIPVEDENEIETLKKSSSFELLRFFPRLQRDFPKEADKPSSPCWIGKE